MGIGEKNGGVEEGAGKMWWVLKGKGSFFNIYPFRESEFQPFASKPFIFFTLNYHNHSLFYSWVGFISDFRHVGDHITYAGLHSISSGILINRRK